VSAALKGLLEERGLLPALTDGVRLFDVSLEHVICRQHLELVAELGVSGPTAAARRRVDAAT
jgi:hypothetical protein